MNGKTVRNAALIAIVSALLFTVTVQPAVCLQTTFTFTGGKVSAEISGEYRADTLTEANQNDVIDKQGMTFEYDEDDSDVGDHDKVVLHKDGSTGGNISSSGKFTVENLVIPEGKDFTFGINISRSYFYNANEITVTITGVFNGVTETKTVTIDGGSASLFGTKYYIKNDFTSTQNIDDVEGYWFNGDSGAYTVNLSGTVSNSFLATLEFSIIFK